MGRLDDEIAALRRRVAELEAELARHHAATTLPRGEPLPGGEATVQCLTLTRAPDGMSRMWSVSLPRDVWRQYAYALTEPDAHLVTLGKAETTLRALLGIGQ